MWGESVEELRRLWGENVEECGARGLGGSGRWQCSRPRWCSAGSAPFDADSDEGPGSGRGLRNPCARRQVCYTDKFGTPCHGSCRDGRDECENVRGRHPRPVPGQARRRGRLRLSRRGQHADAPGADPRHATGSAPSCRGTSRAAASRPRATPAPPARSASAWPPAAPAPPTSSPASPTPRWTRVPIIAITGQVGTPRHRHRRLPGNADRRGLPRPSPSTTTWCTRTEDIAARR